MTSERSAREDRPHIVLHVNEAVADEDFSAAKTALENGFDVEAQQRVEFGGAPEPRIFIDLTGAIDAIAPALAAHGLYDILINALSFFVRRPKGPGSTFSFAMGEGHNRVSGRVISNDQQSLRNAIDGFFALAAQQRPGAYELNQETGRWRKQAPPMLGGKTLVPPKSRRPRRRNK